MTLTMRRGETTDIDMAAERIVNIKLSIGYSHPAALSFTILQPQHTYPIAWGEYIQLFDSDFSALYAVFEGYVSEIKPGTTNEIHYVCYDPTRKAGHDITIMSGPIAFPNIFPRIVYNSKIEQDDDKAMEEESDATVGEIIEDLLTNPFGLLEPMRAAPPLITGLPAYVLADLTPMDYKPQEKVVFETESLRGGLDRMLSLYPQYRMIFEQGSDRRQWRFRDVTAAPQVTLTLNSLVTTKPVYSMSLDRSVDGRYTACKIYGPQKIVKDTAYYIDGSTGDGLDRLWTGLEEGQFQNNTVYATSVWRRFQVSDTTKRQLSPKLPEEILIPMFEASTVGTGLAFKRVRVPVLTASWDSGVTWEPINGMIIEDAVRGIVAAPYHIYKSNSGPNPYDFPDQVKLDFAYYDISLFARYPSSGYSGTAYSEFGMEVEMKRYDEALAIGYERGNPVTSAARIAQFEKLAENILKARRDIVYTGGCVIGAIDYDFLFLNTRINIAAVDEDGNALITGWESIGAILTDAEYDYTDRITTLMFSSDHMEFTQQDPEMLKAWLKIAAVKLGPRFTSGITVAVTRQGFTSLYGSGAGMKQAEERSQRMSQKYMIDPITGRRRT